MQKESDTGARRASINMKCIPNIKFQKKLAQNFKNKIWKVCYTVFAYWHIDDVCQVL